MTNRRLGASNRTGADMPPAEGFDIDFLNHFFDPQRPGYDGAKYFAAVSDDDVDTRPLATRIVETGLLDGQPESVSLPLTSWFAIWPKSSAVGLIRLLREAVRPESPKRVLFVFRGTDGPPAVERTDFPTKDPFADPETAGDLIVIIVRGVHP
jgi:hypothetical protein